MKWWLLFGALLSAGSAYAGNELGNGGDSYALEFASIGRSLVSRLRSQPDPRVGDLAALEAAVESTRVTTLDNLSLKGAEVDAVNYPPEKRIELNRARWRQYDRAEKEALVLHEYLGVAGVEDQNYQVSGSYAEIPEISDESKGARFSLGLGSGVVHAGEGGLAKLYGDSSPVLDFRTNYLLSPSLSARMGVQNWGHSYDVPPVGDVKVGLTRISVGLQYHWAGSAQWRGRTGFDPYMLLDGGNIYRSQNFQAFGARNKDSGFGGGLGVGNNFFFLAKRAAIWIEARADKFFFKDRYQQDYLTAGIADTTGLLYSGGLGLQVYF